MRSIPPTLLAALLLAPACRNASVPTEEEAPFEEPAWRDASPPAVDSPAPVLKRLTQTQYTNALTELFGDALVLPTSLEPDQSVDGLLVVGSSVTSVSPRGVEQYEEAALDVAEQVTTDPTLRAALIPCTPDGAFDDGCAGEVLSALAPRAWRRPLTERELDKLVDLAGVAGATMDDFYVGLSFAINAVLQSPHFLYRIELGEDDPDRPGYRRYTDWEMASRLSFFLWNTLPDAELNAAAAAGELSDDDGIAAQVDRMLADPKARAGLRNFFTELYHLYDLDRLSKDPEVFLYMSDDIGPSSREETLMNIEQVVFEEDGDWRDLLISERTFIDRTLAAIYNVQAPASEGFAEVWLDPADGRRGLLGQVSLLSLYAHATSTSVTRRGIFVRETMLCQVIPSPPANVDTSIPEADAAAPTMRDRVATHLEDPSCASCHLLTDPIGLGLENFDGLGLWRETENSVDIDASGDLDGAEFTDAWGLAEAVRDHPDLVPCLVENVYRYANAHAFDSGERDLVSWHAQGFEVGGYRMLALLRDVAVGPGFRRVGDPPTLGGEAQQ